ncbi:hypothetical protein Phep_2354 [Pedobacter heparinus DSM 2366]|uniref:Secretin/TonB short N-terminal domain-containing protein n=2 Tax=Pedobacter heparinus TaxID=984 RepID=C6XYS6_PEDHD|nr:hypothetical protein Phep_2354 [Pedobacter heparinus DSM 2366]
MKWKLKVTLMLFTLLLSTLGNAYGQVDLSQKLTIPAKKMSFRATLKVLSRLAKVDFAYNSANMPLDERLILVAHEQTLDSILKGISAQLKINFSVIGNTILIDKLRENSQPKEQKFNYKTIDDPLNRRYIITGIVLDAETDLPLEDVIVSLNRNNIKVKTDKEGRFTIYIPYK